MHESPPPRRVACAAPLARRVRCGWAVAAALLLLAGIAPAATSPTPAPVADSAPAALALPTPGAAPAADDQPENVDGAPTTREPERYTVTTESIELAGQDQRVDIYRPVALPADGAAIVAHGWNRSRIRHRDLGRALASAGITAIIPDLPNFLNLWGNGDAIVELAHRLEAGALGLAPIERGRLVLIGTSAGGLATVLAAADLPGLGGWIGLDPVDRTDTAIAAAGRLTAPAVVFLAPSAPCNLFASGRSIGRAVPGLRRMQVFEGASHCDFEDPTNTFCKVLCGSSSPEMQARIRGETVSAALEFLSRPAMPAAGTQSATD